MKYVLSYTNPENHFIDFSLTVNGFSLDQIIVQLPAWRPGRYELGNFAKNIKEIGYFTSGEPSIEFMDNEKNNLLNNSPFKHF